MVCSSDEQRNCCQMRIPRTSITSLHQKIHRVANISCIHGLIFTGLPASRVPRFAPLVEFALAAWARQFELFTSGLTSQHGAVHDASCRRCNSWLTPLSLCDGLIAFKCDILV